MILIVDFSLLLVDIFLYVVVIVVVGGLDY